MHRVFSFLRAINVGGRTVKMGRLRTVFEEMGLASVGTFIASGNVVFECARFERGRLEQRIEKELVRALGYEVATFLRTLDELEAIGAYRPFGERPVSGKATVQVGFLREPPAAAGTKKVLALAGPRDDLAVAGREVFWRTVGPSRESAVSGAALEKTLGMPLTLPNANTVNRLLAKYGGRA